MVSIAVVLIVAATLGLLVTRPRDVSEGVVALAGGVAMIVIGAVSLRDLPRILGETRDVLVFLAGMMILTGIVERAGVFDLLAEACVRLSRGRGRLLYVNLFLLGAVVTATLSLDVTIIVLTPIIYAVTTRRQVDPMPFMFGCAFVANTGSLLLPVSNLTNLLVYHGVGLGFGKFVAVMWLPNVLAVGVNLGIFLWIFRHQIPRHIPDVVEPGPVWIPRDAWLVTNASVLCATLVGLVGLGFAERPLWWASVAGGGLLLVLAGFRRRIAIRQVGHDISLSLFVFVIGMTVIVAGFEGAWLDGRTIGLPRGLAGAVTMSVGAGAMGSNIVNNVPMAVLAVRLIERADPQVREALAYGTLVGTNIGPALTTFGSLATILWLTLLRRYGLVVTTRMYMRISLLTIPPTLVAAGLGLVIVLAMW